jgi:hypothetical protein
MALKDENTPAHRANTTLTRQNMPMNRRPNFGDMFWQKNKKIEHSSSWLVVSVLEKTENLKVSCRLQIIR